MKNKFFVASGCILIILLVFIIYISIISNKAIHQNSNISRDSNNERVQEESKTVEITFDEAVKKKMIYNDMPQQIAKEELIKEENRILEDLAQIQKKASDKTIEEIKSGINPRECIKYYSFRDEFEFPENNDFSVVLESMIVVVDNANGETHIDRADYLSTSIGKGREKAQWVQTASSNNIEINKTVVRLATTGYFTLQEDKPSKNQTIGFENLTTGKEEGILHSKTVYPTFNFRLNAVS